MLKTKRKRYFRNLLHQRLDEIAQKTGGSRRHWDIKGNRFPDLVDWATAEQEREICLRIIERDTALRGEVLLALEKIRPGTYGVCASCRQEIESARLDAMPTTSLCITPFFFLKIMSCECKQIPAISEHHEAVQKIAV